MDHLQTVGEIVKGLRALGLGPVLVGGMALVVLGSRRVTRDFDFVIAHPGARLRDTIALFYDRGLELVARLDDMGCRTVLRDRGAAARPRHHESPPDLSRDSLQRHVVSQLSCC